MSDTNTPVASRSYFIRHWHGDLSLPVSYWINGTVLSIVLGLLAGLVTNSIDISTYPEIFSLGSIGFFIFLTSLTPWQLVGVWRSANRHILHNHGKAIWATLAKISVIIGAVYSVYVVSMQTIPQISEYWKIARGDHHMGEYALRLLRNNTELDFSGRIRFGLTRDVKKILDAHPSIQTIHLNSDGGRIAEARQLRDLIEKRQLMTFTSTGCYSACILAYSAGTKKLISRNAKLGFHQYWFPGLDPSAFKKQYEKDTEYMVAKGIDRNFLAKAFSTPNADMWKPSYEELSQAKMIDGYAEPDQVALSGLKPADIEAIEQTAFNTPFFKILKEYEPEVYGQIISETKEAFQKGLSQAELRSKAQPLIQKVYAKRLPHASNAVLHEFVLLMLDQMEVLKSKDPVVCYNFVFDPTKSINVHQYFSKNLLEREFTVMSNVIQSAAIDRLIPPSQEQVQTQLAQVFGIISKEFTTDINLFDKQITNDIDKTKMCTMTYALYKTILTLPENQAGDLLRFMMDSADK